MRLLIVTQAVDEGNPILGFFCLWLTEFAKHYECIEVICLQEGEHELPVNVRVHSLGKVGSRQSAVGSKIRYAIRFKLLAWKLRREYDAVFVHMNPEYVIIAGPFWRLWGKRVALWYNHPYAGLRLALAARLAHIIFYTSPYAASAKYSKARRMPAGIDTDVFKPRPVIRNRHALYMQGRITPSKHIEVALAALRSVRKEIPDVTLTLVGPEDTTYSEKLKKEFADVMNAVTFLGPRPNRETPVLYSAHGLSINLAADGHYDKSVLESIACGTPVALASHAFNERGVVIAPNMILIEGKPLSVVLSFMLREYKRWEESASHGRDVVVARESLEALAEKLEHELTH
jgi:glycosyltransferase involved in cell wall biosynthesis